LIAALTPLIVGGGNDPWTNVNFAGGDLTVNGLVGDGVSKYLQTGLVPTSIYSSDLSAGMSVYLVTTTNRDQLPIGAATGGTAAYYLGAAYSNAAYFACWNNASGQGTITAASVGWTGFTSGSRTAANAFSIYTASSTSAFGALVSGATTGGTRPNIEIYVMANNGSGSVQLWDSSRMSFAAVHAGLSSADTQALYNRVQALRIALGGGYV
jgi:hypothetical protein